MGAFPIRSASRVHTSRSNSHFGFARGSSLPIETYLAKVVSP
jgi:hypothetical protein